MKHILLIISIIYSQFLNSQIKIEEYKLAAQKSISENNVEDAKTIYKKIAELDPKDKDNWFNLANVEMYLTEKDSACEHYYKAYLLNDLEAGKIMIDKCPNFRDGKIKSIYEVDEKPKFIYKEKELDLFDGKNLNEQYKKIMIKALKNSKILGSEKIGKMFVQIHVNSNGFFDGKIISLGTHDKSGLIWQEVMSIFFNLVKYIPAKHNGILVEVYERWVIPVDFGG